MSLKDATLESAKVASASSRTHFLAVVGLYKMAAEDSTSFRTIQAAGTYLVPDRGSLRILLYDNTPDGQRPLKLPANTRYQAAGKNAGLAEAFNCGIQIAHQEGCDWLITLDQDTSLPPDFLLRVADIAEQLRKDPAIAAIVPQICGDGRMLSPNWFWAGAIARWFPSGFVGVPAQPTFAFNSASTLRVSALRQIGGYSGEFWLDNSDSAVYHQLRRYGKRVFVAGNIQVNHQFSMLDKAHRMTVSRYQNALMAESAFWDLAMNPLAGMERTFRLFGRWCKHVLHGDSAAFRKETARALQRRLFKFRAARIELWKRELGGSTPASAKAEASAGDLARPKVSVCMATCNGEMFVREQLASILQQLEPEDEVIVVDDASQDSTKNLVACFRDQRIRLIENNVRKGVVKTFERAVRSASGDVLFLCDQDDLWAAQKVSRVMGIFLEHPEVTVVATNVQTIDENGQEAYDKVYSKPRPFTSALGPNLVANRFQGSTMAFRSKLIPSVLPFPEGFHVMHDAWIGLRNTVTGGKTWYIDEPLLLYRRHSQNASRRLGPVQQILKRARLAVALAIRWWEDKLRIAH